MENIVLHMGEFENKVKDSVSRGDHRPVTLYTEVESITADHTAVHGTVILADASGGGLTVTLPEGLSSRSVIVKKTDSSGNAVTVTTSGTEDIDGGGDRTITGQYVSREFVSDGSDYYIV